MIDDFVYSVEAFSPAEGDGYPEPLPVGQVADNLRAVVEDARLRRKQGEEAVRLGILTADERDTWTAVGTANPSPSLKLTCRTANGSYRSPRRTVNP